ncbi:hypothetical protein RJ639_031261 [Escallonia herrerae]|uniref:Uncharacterized protein n=1 Tax=Escallonia herrerae TaxID=1293975 RepID=A0AA88X0F0_9ASTE|nr:hypothetical protein RJ639_031261 [Escallonia herrerae]
MAGLRFWFCFILVLLSFTSSEARAPDPFSSSKRRGVLIERAHEIITVSMRRLEMVEGHYQFNRIDGRGDPSLKSAKCFHIQWPYLMELIAFLFLHVTFWFQDEYFATN